MERLNVIARGLIKTVRCTDRRFVAVTPSIVGLCWRLLSIVQKYTFLFEDMFAHFDVEIRRTKVQVECGEYRVISVPFLIDERAADEFWPQLCAKSNVLLQLVLRRDHQRGVIFTRNVRLSDVLEKLFQENRIPVLKLDGRLSSKIRFDQLRQFDALTNGVLIITRTTGKRGLDIPFADYAILYSPKEDEYVMWQELSRIRGTLNSSKDSYILFYESTAEEEKLFRLREDMDHSANRYVFVEN
jgi:superfamily II DNA or RNA helicase